MRVPAISFDPPVGAPTGVTRTQATAAATRTAVSPDGRGSSSAYSRAARDRKQPPSEPAAAPSPADDALPAAPLPTYYPPLGAQRAVLDRPVPEADDVVPAVPAPREEAPAHPRTRAPVPGSPIDQVLRRIIGAG